MSKGLGKPLADMGLDALLEEVTAPINTGIQTLPLHTISPCQHQPRTHFDAQALQTLTASIKTHGVLQPILVKPVLEGYEIIAGERRWRAATQAGLTDIPAIVRETSRSEQAAIALVENIQRENLSPIEEANAIASLVETQAISHQAIASQLGRSRSALSNCLRLLELPETIQSMVHTGQISASHARALLSFAKPQQITLAERIITDGLSVRAIEAMAQKIPTQTPAKKRAPHAALSAFFQAPVALSQRQGKGSLTIRFANAAQLKSILGAVGLNAADMQHVLHELEQDV